SVIYLESWIPAPLVWIFEHRSAQNIVFLQCCASITSASAGYAARGRSLSRQRSPRTTLRNPASSLSRPSASHSAACPAFARSVLFRHEFLCCGSRGHPFAIREVEVRRDA